MLTGHGRTKSPEGNVRDGLCLEGPHGDWGVKALLRKAAAPRGGYSSA